MDRLIFSLVISFLSVVVDTCWYSGQTLD